MKLTLKIFVSILLATLACVNADAQRFRSRVDRTGRVSGTRMGHGLYGGLDYSIGQILTSNDAFTFSAESFASVSSNSDIRPLLSYSNGWGRYTQYKQGEFAAIGAVNYYHRMVDHRFAFSAGLKAEVHTDTKRIMFNEAYLNFLLWMGEVRIGLQEYTPIETNTDLSIGSYLMSNNAHAIPRIWLGVLDYWAPLTLIQTRGFNAKEAFDIRFGLSFGRMDDEGDELATDDICLHEKFFYVRASQWFIKPYIGMYHSVMMGGLTSYSERIPRDLGGSLFGKNGDKSKFSENYLKEELSTPAGANQGMWDFGFDFSTPVGDGKLYYHRPHADGQKRSLFGKNAKDFTIGLQFDLDLPDFPYVQSATIEVMNQKWQGGDAMNIPCVPDQYGSYSYIYLDQLSKDDVETIKNETLVRDDVAAWESANGEITSVRLLEKFLRETYNHGKDFGGRFQYLDNQLYRQGWTRRGLSMGNPLMHTRRTVRTYADDGSIQLLSAFPNTRVFAVNIGAKGNILPGRLDYLWRTTISKNYGNYNEQYFAPDSSAMSTNKLMDNYFFDGGKLEVYTKIDAVYTYNDQLKFKGNIAFDLGDLYSSFSIRLGAIYQFNQDNTQQNTRHYGHPSKRHNWKKSGSTKSKSNLSTFTRGR